jgi:REP element-mobilizing transposase RayT
MRRGRRTIRLQEFDYRSPGAYFVTISTKGAKPIFGRVNHESVFLNRYGNIAKTYWKEIPDHFKFIGLDEFIVMPNHVHGILWMRERPNVDVGAQHAAPLREDKFQVVAGSLAAVIRSFKSSVTRQIRQETQKPDLIVWQRNYYERVIRDQSELEATRNYIFNNAIPHR